MNYGSKGTAASPTTRVHLGCCLFPGLLACPLRVTPGTPPETRLPRGTSRACEYPRPAGGPGTEQMQRESSEAQPSGAGPLLSSGDLT